MKRAGFSPSVRLFEAGACAVPIVSDWWPGLDTIFEPGREILLSSSAEDTLRILRDTSVSDRARIGAAARKRVLNEHTPEKRALQLENYFEEARGYIRKAVPA
jgi:spore maturation protein CgeB